MATYTREQFVRAALQEASVIGADEAPSAEDSVLAGERTQQVFEGLYDDGLIPFDLDAAIPARYFLPLVQIVAVALLSPFGLPGTPLMAANEQGARKRLHQLKAQPYYGAVARATYF